MWSVVRWYAGVVGQVGGCEFCFAISHIVPRSAGACGGGVVVVGPVLVSVCPGLGLGPDSLVGGLVLPTGCRLGFVVVVVPVLVVLLVVSSVSESVTVSVSVCTRSG